MEACSSCSGCSGCDQSLTMTQPELDILTALGQIPFLPIARRMDDPSPIYLEADAYSREEYSLILQCLEKKRLIDLDFERPLKNADYSAYQGYPIHGSMALTARGQQVLELLERQGIQ